MYICCYFVNRFPCNLKYRSYEHGFPIRSLMYDKKTGLLFKLDYFNNISTESCYKGKRKIYEDEILDIYKGKKHLSSEYIKSNLYWMTDLFAYSKTCLLADIIDYFERNIHISYISFFYLIYSLFFLNFYCFYL